MFKKLYSALYRDDCFPFCNLLENPDNVESIRLPEQMIDQDAALVIWGGADITPKFYNHPTHRTTHPGGARDYAEWDLLNKAVDMGIPVIGVCRGAQMLCAKAGGWLIQNVTGHHGGHYVETHDGKNFRVNSIHHQMMAGLDNVEHELVGWVPGNLSSTYGYMDDKEYKPKEGWREPEFVYFNKIRGYAIQWHPEGMTGDCPATEYILNFIREKEENVRAGFATAVVQL